MADVGYPLNKRELLRELKHVLNIDGKATPSPDNLTGKEWFRIFQNRHPEVTMRTPMSLGHERSAVKIKRIKGWYDGVLN